MRYFSLLIILIAFGCTGTKEDENEVVIKVIPKPELEKIEPIIIFDGPNFLEQSGTKMIKSEPIITVEPEVKPVPEVKKEIIKKVVKKKPVKKSKKKLKPVKRIKPTPIPRIVRKFNRARRVKDGYKEVRYYGREGCRGTVYEKEFKKSYFYLFVDCRNNFTTQRMGK